MPDAVLHCLRRYPKSTGLAKIAVPARSMRINRDRIYLTRGCALRRVLDAVGTVNPHNRKPRNDPAQPECQKCKESRCEADFPLKAIVYYSNGSPDVLRCEEIEKPVPGAGQVLISVRAAALNPLDRGLMRSKMPYFACKLTGLTNPSAANPGRLGRDVAGVVEAIGANVTKFK